MKDKIKAILQKEAPLIEWSVEDWPHEEGSLWIKGKIRLEGGTVIDGDGIIALNALLNENGEIRDGGLVPIFDLAGKGPPVSSRAVGPQWVEGSLLSIGYQLGKKLTNRYKSVGKHRRKLE